MCSSSQSEAADDTFATILASLFSYETLRSVGLSEAKATEVWCQWLDWPSNGIQEEVDPDDGGLQMYFDEFIIGQTCGNTNTADDDDDDVAWETRLEAHGFNREAPEAIVDPHFRDARLTEPALFWAKHTIEVRYEGLQDIQAASRERAMALQRRATAPDNKDQNG